MAQVTEALIAEFESRLDSNLHINSTVGEERQLIEAWKAWNRRELSGNSEQVEPVVDHIEDVHGRSMADAAVGPCDCDPHIEYCPSCVFYLQQATKASKPSGSRNLNLNLHYLSLEDNSP